LQKKQKKNNPIGEINCLRLGALSLMLSGHQVLPSSILEGFLRIGQSTNQLTLDEDLREGGEAWPNKRPELATN